MINNNDLFDRMEDLGYQPNGIDENGVISKNHLYNVCYQKDGVYRAVGV